MIKKDIYNITLQLLTALSFKIWTHSREMSYFIAKAVRTNKDINL